MEGIVEPVLLIVGSPIAGNPSQFALEKAFESLSISWRVISCELDPDDLQTAVDGARVLGMRAMLLDHSLKSSIQSGSDAEAADFFVRPSSGSKGWKRESLASQWLRSEIHKSFPVTAAVDNASEASDSPEVVEKKVLWIGERDKRFPNVPEFLESKSPIAWISESELEETDLIAVSESEHIAPLETERWPEARGNKLVIDFSSTPGRLRRFQDHGYQVIDVEAIRIGTLGLVVERLTGEVPDQEVLREAIEEYFAV